MDRDKLKEKMRLAISVRQCQDADCNAQQIGNGLCLCEVDAEAALTAIEEAGYVIKAKEPTTKWDGAHSVSVCPCPSCIAYRNSKIQGVSNG